MYERALSWRRMLKSVIQPIELWSLASAGVESSIGQLSEWCSQLMKINHLLMKMFAGHTVFPHGLVIQENVIWFFTFRKQKNRSMHIVKLIQKLQEDLPSLLNWGYKLKNPSKQLIRIHHRDDSLQFWNYCTSSTICFSLQLFVFDLTLYLINPCS